MYRMQEVLQQEEEEEEVGHREEGLVLDEDSQITIKFVFTVARLAT